MKIHCVLLIESFIIESRIEIVCISFYVMTNHASIDLFVNGWPKKAVFLWRTIMNNTHSSSWALFLYQKTYIAFVCMRKRCVMCVWDLSRLWHMRMFALPSRSRILYNTYVYVICGCGLSHYNTLVVETICVNTCNMWRLAIPKSRSNGCESIRLPWHTIFVHWSSHASKLEIWIRLCNKQIKHC